jgi:hypothetical protein
VAAAILAAVEDGILPPGMATLNAEVMLKFARQSTGQDAQFARAIGERVRRRKDTDISAGGSKLQSAR